MWLAFWHKGCYEAGALGDWVFKKLSYHFAFHVTFRQKITKKKPCWRYCEILDEKEEHKYMQSQTPLYKVFDLSYT